MRVLILLLIATVGYSQSAKKIAKRTTTDCMFVKTAYPRTTLSCEYLTVTSYIGKTRIILNTTKDSLDLKVTRRKKMVWYAKNSDGIKYHILAETNNRNIVLMFIPEEGSGLKGIMLSNLNVCK